MGSVPKASAPRVSSNGDALDAARPKVVQLQLGAQVALMHVWNSPHWHCASNVLLPYAAIAKKAFYDCASAKKAFYDCARHRADLAPRGAVDLEKCRGVVVWKTHVVRYKRQTHRM